MMSVKNSTLLIIFNNYDKNSVSCSTQLKTATSIAILKDAAVLPIFLYYKFFQKTISKNSLNVIGS